MQKKRRFSIKTVIKTLIFWMLVVSLTSYIVVETFVPERTLGVFGFKPYVVLTASMEPVIREDDVVVIRHVDVEQLAVDDIITFYTDLNFDGNLEVVTHYVYAIDQDDEDAWVIRTRPYYANPEDYSPDPWVLGEDDVLGEHWFTVPRVGLVIRFLQSPYGIAALIVNVTIIASIVILLKDDKKKTNEMPEADSDA